MALQTRLGHRFSQPVLLERALTHRSYSADHYERLEFLGDSVLGLAVSGLLYERLSRQAEGELSRIRSNLVKEDTLAGLAGVLGLSGLLRLGEGELRSGGARRPSILADALEAVIGAVYLDAGFAAAEALVRRLYQGVDINPDMSARSKDAKTALQEWLQGRKMKLPVYRVVGTSGEAHCQTFEVECEVQESGLRQRGSGSSRRAAEQAAAAAVLQQLNRSKS
ncbi:MAG: putative ribonuclease [Pseudomonadota bacterium]